MKKIPTSQLIELLKAKRDSVFEVSLSNQFFKATHFIYFGGRKLFDTGIDSQETTWLPDEFLRFYPQAFWTIEQIVPQH